MYTSIFGVRNCDLIWKNFILYSGGSNTVGTILPQCTKYLLGPRGWSPLGPVKYFVHFGNIISPYYYHPHIVNSYFIIGRFIRKYNELRSVCFTLRDALKNFFLFISSFSMSKQPEKPWGAWLFKLFAFSGQPTALPWSPI